MWKRTVPYFPPTVTDKQLLRQYAIKYRAYKKGTAKALTEDLLEDMVESLGGSFVDLNQVICSDDPEEVLQMIKTETNEDVGKIIESSGQGLKEKEVTEMYYLLRDLTNGAEVHLRYGSDVHIYLLSGDAALLAVSSTRKLVFVMPYVKTAVKNALRRKEEEVGVKKCWWGT